MTYGLRIRDASNNITLDTNSRMSRCLGVLQITGSGSLSDPGFATGDWWALELYGAYTSTYVTFSMSGTTLTWTVQGGGNPINSTMIYGIY